MPHNVLKKAELNAAVFPLALKNLGEGCINALHGRGLNGVATPEVNVPISGVPDWGGLIPANAGISPLTTPGALSQEFRR